MRQALHAKLWAALPALGLTAACLRPAPEWSAILAEVRAKYPDVRQVSSAELLAREVDPGPILLDARSREEFEVSHLRGAACASDEAAAVSALAGVGSEREIVVYCSVGMRSAALAEKLNRRGFENVANLEGGIFAWANEGNPLYRGETVVEVVHPFDERWGALLAPERRAR